MRVRRRVRVQNERSKYRFSKQKMYYSEQEEFKGLSFSYMGKDGGVFWFLVIGKDHNGSWRGYENDMDKLNLKEK